jgi:hypothetical protein
MSDLKCRIDKYLSDHEQPQVTCISHELLREASASLPVETTTVNPFDHAAIMGIPEQRRITMSFEKQEQYEAALVFLDMNDSPVEPTPRHSRDCACTSCHYSKKFPQVKPHHATCGCFECVPVKASGEFCNCLHGVCMGPDHTDKLCKAVNGTRDV